MPEICYVPKRFRNATLGIIVKANAIITAYQEQGFRLTLRQIYYQMIARDLFPESWIDPVYNAKHGLPPDTKNTLKNYKRLGDILNDGRLAGLIDWEAIEDRTRNLESNAHWGSPGQIVRACAQQFRFDLWGDQDYYCEVWIEKEALVGIVEGICTELDVSYFACRGYVSQSEMWVAAQRLIEQEDAGKDTIIFHLGDHDPSGMDMTRDIMDRLEMFGSMVEIRRIALNMDQIEEYNPPPNPAKTTDARYDKYWEEHGHDSWELDALEPKVLVDLIRTKVNEVCDEVRWDAQVERQEQAQEELQLVARQWQNVVRDLQDEE